MAKKKKGNDFLLNENQANVDLAFKALELIESGITPQQYESLYEIYSQLNAYDFGDLISEFETKQKAKKKSKADKKFKPTLIKPTDNKTIKLKVQLKGVTKPPVWREVSVPVTFTFLDLHEAIQHMFGLYDVHMWVFGYHAYDPSLCITLENSAEDMTHDACQTNIIEFLNKKGDKLVYLYDFGDDWTFDVTVVDVTDEFCQCVQLGKWKGNLQLLEDTGGVYAYVGMRTFLEEYDKLTPKQRAKRAAEFGYDDHEQLKGMLDDAIIDPDYVQVQLGEIL